MSLLFGISRNKPQKEKNISAKTQTVKCMMMYDIYEWYDRIGEHVRVYDSQQTSVRVWVAEITSVIYLVPEIVTFIGCIFLGDNATSLVGMYITIRHQS